MDLSKIVLTDRLVDALVVDDLRAYFAPCAEALDFPATTGPRVARNHFDCPRNHMVYFVGEGLSGTPIKIGWTQQALPARLKCIQNGYPARLSVLATQNAPKAREGFYHRRFADHRLFGEWFSPAPAILAEIDRLKDTPNGH